MEVMCHLLEKRNTSSLLPPVLGHLWCTKMGRGGKEEKGRGWYVPFKGAPPIVTMYFPTGLHQTYPPFSRMIHFAGW